MMSIVTCLCISNSAFGMLLKRTTVSNIAKKNSFLTKQCNHRTQFNRAELLQQLEEQKHRLTPEKFASIKTFIASLPTETSCEPGKTKDRDFSQGNMNKE